MKTLLFLPLFQLATLISIGQAQVLKKYDFNKGGYSILGIHSDNKPYTTSKLADSIGEFYTNEITVLNLFKKEWIFKKPVPHDGCGYHYAILICKNGLELERFLINLDCDEIATSKGSFSFDPNKLRVFKDDLKKLIVKNEEFATLNEARATRADMLTRPDLLTTNTPEWTKYEGEFTFTYSCKEQIKNCILQENKLLRQLSNEMRKAFPNEKFELECVGGSKRDLEVLVKGYKTLMDKFNLYPLRYKDWDPYSLSLTSYWASK